MLRFAQINMQIASKQCMIDSIRVVVEYFREWLQLLKSVINKTYKFGSFENGSKCEKQKTSQEYH